MERLSVPKPTEVKRMAALQCHIIFPSGSHTHTVMFLHGRDSTAEQFQEELFESQASDGRYLTEIFPHGRWVFPKSKIRPSARFGQDLSQWFDIWSTEDSHAEKQIQLEGLGESVQFVRQVIEIESKLVPLSHIILCGISQGCATALCTLLCNGRALGGFVGLCGWMSYEDEMRKSVDKLTALREMKGRWDRDFGGVLQDSHSATGLDALATPVFISHSRDDMVVPVQHGMAMSMALQELGMQVTWKEYESGGHWVQEPQGVDDLVEFMAHLMTENLASRTES